MPKSTSTKIAVIGIDLGKDTFHLIGLDNRGIAVRQGLRFLRAELPGILASREDVLSPHMIRLIQDLARDWRRLDEHIESLSDEIARIAKQDPHCQRAMSVPGVGPIVSSAMVAAIGTGGGCSKVDYGCWREDCVYCAGKPMGERLRREFQCPPQGRAAERRDLIFAPGGSDRHRELAPALQCRPAARVPRLQATGA